MGIGERLRAMRKKRGMTLTELGKRSKVSKSYLSQLENGQFSNPSTEIVTRLCGALGISGGAILGLEEMAFWQE